VQVSFEAQAVKVKKAGNKPLLPAFFIFAACGLF
jgi:hypothetical protein